MPPVTAIKPAPTSLIACIILVRLTIYLLSANQYGFMSDELYFLDASYHPAFGYVDFPPVIAWLFTGIRILFSESLWIFRLAAALIGVVVVLVAVDICRLTGGGLVARWVTAGIVLFAPGVLSVHGLLTMNVLDQLWWLLSFWLLIQYLDRGEKAFMWGLGAVLGVGIMTKLSIAALALGILAATLALRRDLFRRPETWSAALLAMADPK
jgi:4-amino-4-deoxy-L-arabinose transferase-like glycosyltransferase